MFSGAFSLGYYRLSNSLVNILFAGNEPVPDNSKIDTATYELIKSTAERLY